MVVSQKQVQLVRNGEVCFSVHRLPWQTAECLLGPADELIGYMRRSFGQPIPQPDVMAKTKLDLPIEIVLNLDFTAELEREEFEIHVDPKRVLLRGRTEAAVFHAVYWFLEEALGVRWLWPGASGEVVPKHQDLCFECGTWRKKPDYAWRNIGLGGSMYAASDRDTMLHGVLGLPLEYLQECDRWCRRNRFGGLKIADGHRWSEIAPAERFGQSDPDLYALIDGKRDNVPMDGKHYNQPCLSNPKVINRMADYACARFDAQGDLDGFSIALNDGGGQCQCDNCLELDRQFGAEGIQTIEHVDKVTDEAGDANSDQKSVTDRVIWQANQVAKKVAERFSNRKILMILYSFFRRPPVSQKLGENVIGQYCVMGHSFWNEEARDTELNRIKEMSKSVPSFAVYEYFSNGAWPEMHRLFPRLVEQSVRDYYKAGVRYYSTQPTMGFATNGLNLFMLGRCLWDTTTSYDSVLEDYCRSGFGAAKASMQRFFEAFSDRWKQTVSGTELPQSPVAVSGTPWLPSTHLYTGEFLAQRRGELAEACRLAAGDQEVLGRIEFMEVGLTYTEKYCHASKLTLDCLDKADSFDDQGLPIAASTGPAVKKAAKLAFAAWGDYWQFVRGKMGRYVFGELWVHYRPGPFGERDALLRRLGEIATESSS